MDQRLSILLTSTTITIYENVARGKRIIPHHDQCRIQLSPRVLAAEYSTNDVADVSDNIDDNVEDVDDDVNNVGDVDDHADEFID